MKRNSIMNPSSSSPGSKSICHECINGSKWIFNNALQPEVVACKCRTPTPNLPLGPSGVLTGIVAQKRFLVFDRSGGKTNLIVGSESPPMRNLNQKYLASGGLCMNVRVSRSTNGDLRESNKTSTSDSNGGDEMHEDTEEIDALLYSGSEDEDVTSTDHSPDKTSASEEEVASSTVPTKRKRRIGYIDTDLTDTASSETRFHHCKNAGNDGSYDAVKHGCIKYVGNEREISSTNGPNKRLRSERIDETTHVLRRIIPGGRGKDTIDLLDKAIRYLRFLKGQTKNQKLS